MNGIQEIQNQLTQQKIERLISVVAIPFRSLPAWLLTLDILFTLYGGVLAALSASHLQKEVFAATAQIPTEEQVVYDGVKLQTRWTYFPERPWLGLFTLLSLGKVGLEIFLIMERLGRVSLTEENQVEEFIQQLDPVSGEALFFEEFAKKYNDPITAAREYLSHMTATQENKEKPYVSELTAEKPLNKSLPESIEQADPVLITIPEPPIKPAELPRKSNSDFAASIPQSVPAPNASYSMPQMPRRVEVPLPDRMGLEVAKKMELLRGGQWIYTSARTTPAFYRLFLDFPPRESITKLVASQLYSLDILAVLQQFQVEIPPMFSLDGGKLAVDIARPDREIAYFRDYFPAPHFDGRYIATLGVAPSGNLIQIDLESSSHAHGLVAGQNGGGKSELLNTMVYSLCYHVPPQDLRLFLIDTKRTAFFFSDSFPWLEKPISYDPGQALKLIQDIEVELRQRYILLGTNRCSSILEWNSRFPLQKMPRWVLVIDEYADLLALAKNQGINLEEIFITLTSLGRAAGIHLILATQTPNSEVITAQIKSNVNYTLGLRVVDQYKSGVIAGIKSFSGLKNLLGKGDFMLFDVSGINRGQALFVDRASEEVDRNLLGAIANLRAAAVAPTESNILQFRQTHSRVLTEDPWTNGIRNDSDESTEEDVEEDFEEDDDYEEPYEEPDDDSDDDYEEPDDDSDDDYEEDDDDSDDDYEEDESENTSLSLASAVRTPASFLDFDLSDLSRD